MAQACHDQLLGGAPLEGRTFTVMSKPVELTEMNYLVTVHETEGPDAGRQLTVQVRLGLHAVADHLPDNADEVPQAGSGQ